MQIKLERGLDLINYTTKDFIPRSFYYVMIYHGMIYSKYPRNL
jgi:hypothetical protein